MHFHLKFKKLTYSNWYNIYFLEDSDGDIITDFLCNQGDVGGGMKNNMYNNLNVNNNLLKKLPVPIISVTPHTASYKYGHILGKYIF